MLTPVPPSACIRAREAVSARLDGELNELDAHRLDQHLAGCPSCRAFAAGASAVALELRTAEPVPAPAELFVPRRRRVAAPLAASAAALLVALATGSSFLVGQLLGAHSGGGRAPATTAASPTGVDPAMVAMLRDRGGSRSETGRVIAL
jgi:predicted anti-sigma-YlaC factor YlaD